MWRADTDPTPDYQSRPYRVDDGADDPLREIGWAVYDATGRHVDRDVIVKVLRELDGRGFEVRRRPYSPWARFF